MKKLLLYIFALLVFQECQAQIISIRYQDFAFKEAKLAYAYADGIYHLKSTTLNENGFGLFDNTSLETGIFYVFLSDSISYEFFYDEADPSKIAFNYNKEQNVMVLTAPKTTMEYDNFLRSLQKTSNDGIFNENNRDVPKKGKQTFLAETKNKYINTLKDSLIDITIQNLQSNNLKAYLKAQHSIAIPDYMPPEHIFNKDSSIWRYQLSYYYKHYLDNLDICNKHLIHTPIYTQKINFYLDQVTSQEPRHLVNSVDYLLGKASCDSTTQHFMAAYLLEKYNKRKNNTVDEYVYLHIIEKHYLQSGYSWITNKDLSILNREYNRRKPASIGEIAPNIVLPGPDDDTIRLKDIQNEFILLYFFNYDCPLCNKITPEIKKLLSRYDYLDIRVVTVCIGENKEMWKNYIYEKNISNWINLFGNGEINQIAYKYNLSYTPTLLLVDKDKKIIDKNLNIAQLEKLFLRIAIKKHK
jgi:peroxiredoxin